MIKEILQMPDGLETIRHLYFVQSKGTAICWTVASWNRSLLKQAVAFSFASIPNFLHGARCHIKSLLPVYFLIIVSPNCSGCCHSS